MEVATDSPEEGFLQKRKEENITFLSGGVFHPIIRFFSRVKIAFCWRPYHRFEI